MVLKMSHFGTSIPGITQSSRTNITPAVVIPNGVVSLADVLHVTFPIGMEPTTSLTHPQVTAIQGLRATLNLDAGGSLPYRPIAAGASGPVGLSGVSFLSAAGEPITVRGGEGGVVTGGSLFLRGGACYDGIGGGVFISAGKSSGAGNIGGAVSITSGNADFPNATGDATLESAGSQVTGAVYVRSGAATAGVSGQVIVSTGDTSNASAKTGQVKLLSGTVLAAGATGRSGHIRLETGPNTPTTSVGEVVIGSSISTPQRGRHVIVEQGTKPTIAGTGVPLVSALSSDTCGTLTGLSPLTSYTVTFLTPYSSNPVVILTPLVNAQSSAWVTSVSTTSFTFQCVGAASMSVSYFVIGVQAFT